jgi:hypothetical protein
VGKVNQLWFSALLRFVVYVDDAPSSVDRSVVVLLAEDFSCAFKEALLIGHTMEAEYTGALNNRVRRRLEEVETLDLLGDSITHGREVYSELVEVPPDRGDRTPRGGPESSKPGQSGV